MPAPPVGVSFSIEDARAQRSAFLGQSECTDMALGIVRIHAVDC